MSIQNQLSQLFEDWQGQKPTETKAVAPSGSRRKYFRLKNAQTSAIGSWNDDLTENKAFLYLSAHFQSKQLPVPKIYAVAEDQLTYLQEDLGDTTLFHAIEKQRKGSYFPESLIQLYQKTINGLIRIQTEGAEGLDFSHCYPRAAFDQQSILWDLNYFKYYFLKLNDLVFDEQGLEDDFQTFAAYLLQADSDYFLFRDCQSRNVMLVEGEAFFIDYQGGRKGPLQYDLASLLFQARAKMPADVRSLLLNYYLDRLNTVQQVDRELFKQQYYGFVFIRCLQVLGAYGFRGLFQRKAHFLKSIPPALDNLKWLLDNHPLPIELPHLNAALKSLTENKQFESFRQEEAKEGLTITVCSFSYHKGLPKDLSGNGGGFLFDCRSVLNPGRFTPYKRLTGRDAPVKEFLEKESKIDTFLAPIYQTVDKAVETYLERNFSHMSVGFGCTGGQHRSVYSADKMAQHLSEKYSVTIKLHHIVQDAKNWKN